MLSLKIKLILLGGLALCVIALGIIVNKWRLDSLALKSERAAFQLQLSSKENVLKTERENRRKADERAKSYARKMADLDRARRDDPLPPVIVRSCPADRVSAAGTTAATVVRAPEADDAKADEGNRDIGPELDHFATDAESNLIQCQELQEWAQALAPQ